MTYSDCTLGNHVYYARYLELLEWARGEFFRQINEPFLKWQRADTIFPVVECRLRYRNAARYDDLLTIEIWLTELERIRLNFGYRITNEAGAEVLAAATKHACTSIDEKLKRLPEELASKLRPYCDPST